MRHPLSELPELRPLPSPYQLREATDDDARGIGEVLSEAFGDTWSDHRVFDILLHHPEVPRTFVVDHEGSIVATASYQMMPNAFPDSGWVHYVGATARHNGLGLGYIVSRAVLEECLRLEMKDVYLTTDDFRLPAIRTYLKLGFQPDCWHDSHPTRWATVIQNLEISKQ
jgi:mycothiol synthase